MADELGMNNPVSGGAFETEDSKASTPTKKGGGGMFGGIKAVKEKVGSAVDGAVHSVTDAAKHGLEEASRVKELKKFLDLDLEVFSSTEEADRLEEELDHMNRAKWCGILHPETTTSVVYNQMHVFFLLYMLVVLPVRTAFQMDPSPGTLEFGIDVFMDVCIFIDICLNFKKFTKDGPELVTDPKIIRQSYLRGWFIVDFLSVLPFNYIMLAVSSSDNSNLARSTRFIRFIRVARFVRLIKLAKLSQLRDAMRYFKDFLAMIGISAMEVEFALRMVGLVVIMLGIGHIIACLWLHVGRSGLSRDPPEGWMVGSHEIGRIVLPDCIPVDCIIQSTGILPDCVPVDCITVEEGEYVHEQYVDSFYWAIVTMSSVGYGDVLPTTTNEREIGVIVITIGAFLYAYIIGAFSTIMAALDHDSARYDTKMRTVANYLKFLNVDPKTVVRVNRYYEFRFANKIMFEEDDIVSELPPKLKAEIVLQRFQKTVDRIPFFRGLNEDVITSICVQFREFAVLPGDFIMHRGDPYTELLILTKGQCRSVPPEEDEEILSPRSFGKLEAARMTSSQDSADGLCSSDDGNGGGVAVEAMDSVLGVIEYPTGSFFGELEFLSLSDTRPTSIRAKAYCELSSLHPSDISDVVENCDALKQRMAKYAELKLVLAREHCGELEAERKKQETEDGFADDDVDSRKAAQAVDQLSGDTNAKMMHMLQDLVASNKEVVQRLSAVEAAVGVGPGGSDTA